MNWKPIPEEQEDPALIQQLQEVFRMNSEDKASLDRIQARLFQTDTTQLSVLDPKPAENVLPYQNGQFHPSVSDRLPQRQKSWPNRLALIAAVLLIMILTGATISTFFLMKGKSGPAGKTATAIPPTSTPTTTPAQAHHILGNGVSLYGKGLYMVTEQKGWYAPNTKPGGGPLFRTTDGGQTWQSVTLPQELSQQRFNVTVLDENTVLIQPLNAQAGTALLNFYWTDNGGATWQQRNWPTTPAIDQDGTGDFRSTFLDNLHGWVFIHQIMFNGGGLPMQAPTQTLFKTDDGGQTWQQVVTLPFKYPVLTITFNNAQTGWITTTIDDPNHSSLQDRAAFPTTLYVTHDGGKNWSQQVLPAPTAHIVRFSGIRDITFQDEKQGYFIGSYTVTDLNIPQNDYLYTTHDGGNSWQINGPAFPTFGMYITDTNHIYDGKYLYELKNGQWTKTSNVLVDADRIQFLSSQQGIALVNYRDFSNSTDGGKSWHKISTLPQS